MNYLNIIISLSPFLISLPFTLLDVNKFNKNEKQALWQPPGYIFGIVWPILYVLLFIFNYSIISGKFNNIIKNIAKFQIIIEAFLQGIWLYVFRYSNNGRKSKQYENGLIILFFSLLVSYSRISLIYKNKSNLLVYYLPYVIWIHFAFILNLQLTLNITK